VVACSSTGKSPPTCRKDSRKDCASAVSGFGIFGLSKHSSPPGTSYTPPSSATMASVSPLAFSTKPTVLSAYGGERGPVWADRSAGRTLSRAVRGVFTPFFLCQDSTGSSGGGLHGLTGSPAANPSASRTSTGGSVPEEPAVEGGARNLEIGRTASESRSGSAGREDPVDSSTISTNENKVLLSP